jgi:hypothetical protein
VAVQRCGGVAYHVMGLLGQGLGWGGIMGRGGCYLGVGYGV